MRLFVILSSLIFLLGCDNKRDIAFYHWKSSCDINSSFKYPIYLKVLDISSDGTYIKTKCKSIKYTSVVYIENGAFKRGVNISKIVLKNIPKNQKEVQFDCDWTQGTKDRYFKFLKDMKRHYKRVTTTIRLHQIKYQKSTGVPPVDGGVLMLYNMSDFLSLNTRNYILDLEEAKKYLKNFKGYPLKLDLALPLYSMGTLIRYSRVVRLIDNIKSKELDKKYFKKMEDNRYLVLKTHYFKGKLLYKGDILRVDEVTLDMLKEAISIIPFEFKRVIYFRYSNLDSWDIEELEKI